LRIWKEARRIKTSAPFLRQVCWREFSAYMLYHNPDMPEQPLRLEFKKFPWLNNRKTLKAWQQGRTGYPLIDAGMRELWETGYMHNRVRMAAASFLIKHLMQPWQEGEKWFWDTLADADLGNNAANWQWVAGCGTDAAPYFRIFNPVLQGKKFDANGHYVRRWLPELANVPDKFLHDPWNSPNPPAGYPAPIVDHAAARERALAAFRQIKKEG
jgi:deoxyribodipyrimidine photo-lyase